MSKNKINRNVEPVEVVEEIPVVEEVVEEKKEFVFPEVSRTGKFQSVEVEGGFVVYNPVAQRVSGILTATQANDIVREQNLAAHIK